MFGFLKRNKGKSVNVNDLDGLIGTIEIIDIREPHEFKGGSIKSAKNIPTAKLLENPERYLKKEKTYYLLCLTGMRSGRAAKILAKQGFSVIPVSGGMGSYAGKNKS